MENDSTFARTRRDEGGIEPPVLSYILQRPIRSIQYCEYVLYRMLSYRTQELPLGSASPVLGVMREGLNHLCFPTYYGGPFVASNIANMYCTECIIGIIQNAGTPSRLRFARTCELPLGSATEAQFRACPCGSTGVHSHRPQSTELYMRKAY